MENLFIGAQLARVASRTGRILTAENHATNYLATICLQNSTPQGILVIKSVTLGWSTVDEGDSSTCGLESLLIVFMNGEIENNERGHQLDTPKRSERGINSVYNTKWSNKHNT